ncbi:MAG: hypothetical protein J3R72DRAFT_502202 [Linnemannia gamsii]|nr:MAG: hypothetical protein J3R72DRAFT_502202 [Linnemannia gamsii]
MAKRAAGGLTFENDPAFPSSKKAKLDLKGEITPSSDQSKLMLERERLRAKGQCASCKWAGHLRSSSLLCPMNIRNESRVNEMRIAYAVLFPLPPDRMPSTSSVVDNSVGMENMRPPAAVDVPNATANVPLAVVDVPLAVVDVPDDVDNGQDKHASFWLKKCTRCPLFGHSRSISHMCLENPINAHSDVDLRGRQLRQYDIPASAEVAGLIPGDPSISHRDIVMMHREPKEGKKYHRIDETNAIYDGVCYPLLFPCGDLTWSYNTYDKLKTTGPAESETAGTAKLRPRLWCPTGRVYKFTGRSRY